MDKKVWYWPYLFYYTSCKITFIQKGDAVKLYGKNLSFLLLTLSFQCFTAQQSSVATISTVPQVVAMLSKIIIHFPGDDTITLQEYEKKQSKTILTCAKILYDTAYAQILDTLQEIDNRLAYWKYQKTHQWSYFLTKNPMKWVTGAPQGVEIEHNIDQLQSHQGELYVVLGQLAEHGNAYDHKYKTVFMTNYQQAYAWVDTLLDLLIRINISVQNFEDISPFIARVMLLKAKLEKVRSFKNQLLMEMQDTQIPATFERNWLKYGAAAAVLGLGYQNISFDQIKNSLEALKNNFVNYIVEPVHSIIKDVFVPTGVQGDLLVSRENIDVIKQSIKNFINGLSISADQKKQIVEDIALGKSGSFQALVDNIAKGWNYKRTIEGKNLLYEFILLQGAERTQKQIAGVAKIGFLTPALLSSWPAYKGYQRLTAKDYAPIRRALVDINFIFVDPTQPLDDEQYGKMLYLIYNLKKRAEKDVPLNDRADFMQDLERIESKEFGVAAKRAIVEDMFRKYSFLKLT